MNKVSEDSKWLGITWLFVKWSSTFMKHFTITFSFQLIWCLSLYYISARTIQSLWWFWMSCHSWVVVVSLFIPKADCLMPSRECFLDQSKLWRRGSWKPQVPVTISAHIVTKVNFCSFWVILKIRKFVLTSPCLSHEGRNLWETGVKFWSVGLEMPEITANSWWKQQMK